MPVVAVGIDAFTQPTGAQIAAGTFSGLPLTFTGVYLDVVSGAQIANFHANGISTFYIWQNSIHIGGNPNDPTSPNYFTYQAGVNDGINSRLTWNGVTVPAGRPVYYPIDFGAGSANVGAISSYFSGLNSVLPLNEIGIYADAYILDQIKNQGLAYYFWQNRSSGYPNNSTQYPYAALWQYPPGYSPSGNIVVGGISVDADYAFIQDFGQDPAPAGSAPPAGSTSTAVAPSGGTYNASLTATSSFSQPSSQSLVTPATGHDQVIYSVTTSDATLANGTHNAFYEIPTNINQSAYPIGIFSYDGGATWNDFGFQLPVSPTFTYVKPGVTLQPSVDASGNIFFNGVNNTGSTVNLIISIALLASYSPGVLTKPAFFDKTNVSYTNQYQTIPPYVPPYSSYRRIDKDSHTGTGSVTVAHGQSTIPNIMFWVNVGGFTTINAIGWQSTGSLGVIGVKLDSTNMTFHVDAGTYNDCYYRSYKDN